jgi:hypothetical protein
LKLKLIGKQILEGELALPSVCHHFSAWFELIPPNELGSFEAAA